MLDRIAALLAPLGVTADAVTLTGFVLGLAATAAIALSAYWTGLFLLLASRLCDGLDGAVARATHTTDFGGFLDIVLDFAFYGAIPIGFAIAAPQVNAMAAAVLVLAFYANGASFLAFAIMAERRGLRTAARGEKSLFFTTGLAEATETIALFVLMCLAPQWFAPLAYLFAVLCLWTTAARILLARRLFR